VSYFIDEKTGKYVNRIGNPYVNQSLTEVSCPDHPNWPSYSSGLCCLKVADLITKAIINAKTKGVISY